MALGHVAMAIENEFFLYVALAFLIAGNGFFKPNISSMVGGLYGENDPRRDRGFTIFYLGINLGAALQFIPAFLGETIGWWLGFGLAGVGMAIGLFVFWRGQHVLGDNGDPPDVAKLKKPLVGPLNVEWTIYVLAFLSVALFAMLVRFYEVMGLLLPTVAGIGFLIVLVSAIRSPKVVRERLFVVLILTLFNIVFWAFFEQAGSSMSLFTMRNVDRQIAGTYVPTSVFQSVNPLFILLLAPLFSLLWRGLNKIGREPSMPVKFSWGLMQLGLGFLVMVLGMGFVFVGPTELAGGLDKFVTEVQDPLVIVQAALVPLWVLLAGYFFHTTGELCLSPIGLSMVTKLSPKKMVAMVMGLWFLSTSLSHHVAGTIAALTSIGADGELEPGEAAVQAGILQSAGDHSDTVLASFDQLASYASVFWPIGWVAVGSGVLLLLISPLLKKWQHGIE
jgi:POT family proton-dependent oligopeptide transporter